MLWIENEWPCVNYYLFISLESLVFLLPKWNERRSQEMPNQILIFIYSRTNVRNLTYLRFTHILLLFFFSSFTHWQSADSRLHNVACIATHSCCFSFFITVKWSCIWKHAHALCDETSRVINLLFIYGWTFFSIRQKQREEKYLIHIHTGIHCMHNIDWFIFAANCIRAAFEFM